MNSVLRLDNTRGTFADSGTYALMGAAGTLLSRSISHAEILDLDSTPLLIQSNI